MHGNSRFEWPLVAQAATPCSESQWRYLQPLKDQLVAWSRSDEPLPSDGGLPGLLAAIRERAQKTGDLQSYSAMSISDEVSLACATGTRKLTAESMALPTISGQTPLVVPTVPIEVERALALEGGFQKPVLPDQISRTYTSISSWPEISREMIERRLTTLLPPKETPHFRGRRVTAGLFGVEKKGTSRSRVIVDRRAQNDLELNLRDVILVSALQGAIEPDRAAYLLRLMTLPYAAQFTRLLMTRTSRLAISTEDAADYYYHLKLPLAAVRTNCVGPLLDAESLRHGSAAQKLALQEAEQVWGPHDRWSVCLVAPPMGDKKAPDVAQCVHCHLGWQSGCLTHATCMSHGFPSPRGPLWIGCYVDDFAQVAVLDQRLPAPWSEQQVHAMADKHHQKML
eukprot:3552694-Amphidinium_carterae.1